MKAMMITLTVLLLASPVAMAKPTVPDLGDVCANTLCDECPVDGSCELPLPRPGVPALPCLGPYACELPLLP